MNILVLLIVVLASSHQISGDQVRYDDFKVIRLTPRTQEAALALKALQDSEVYDFWTEVRGVGRPVDVMVAPNFEYRLNDTIASGDFDTEVYIANVQELIDNERPRSVVPAALEWENYHTLEEINDWLTTQADEKAEVTLVTVGRSYEGREILGIKISYSPENENRAVFIESNIHAREWITSAVVTWMTNEILTSEDSDVRATVERYDWYIVPVFNPDGLAYTQTDRMWRKTRKPYFLCVGVDPNRNWGYHFNEGGASVFPCSQTYPGPEAFSEDSTRTISEYIQTIGTKLHAYLAFHSYGQLMLLPYGYSPEHLENFDELLEVGEKAAETLAGYNGTQYVVGNIVEALYIASGGSMDWVKGTFGTRVTYTYELRDKGRYGFILPPHEILPTAIETWDSVLTILDEFENIDARKNNQ